MRTKTRGIEEYIWWNQENIRLTLFFKKFGRRKKKGHIKKELPAPNSI